MLQLSLQQEMILVLHALRDLTCGQMLPVGVSVPDLSEVYALMHLTKPAMHLHLD